MSGVRPAEASDARAASTKKRIALALLFRVQFSGVGFFNREGRLTGWCLRVCLCVCVCV